MVATATKVIDWLRVSAIRVPLWAVAAVLLVILAVGAGLNDALAKAEGRAKTYTDQRLQGVNDRLQRIEADVLYIRQRLDGLADLAGRYIK